MLVGGTAAEPYPQKERRWPDRDQTALSFTPALSAARKRRAKHSQLAFSFVPALPHRRSPTNRVSQLPEASVCSRDSASG